MKRVGKAQDNTAISTAKARRFAHWALEVAYPTALNVHQLVKYRKIVCHSQCYRWCYLVQAWKNSPPRCLADFGYAMVVDTCPFLTPILILVLPMPMTSVPVLRHLPAPVPFKRPLLRPVQPPSAQFLIFLSIIRGPIISGTVRLECHRPQDCCASI